VHELDAAANNSVDDIRSEVDQVRFAPQVGKYNIYIIDEVHMLSTSAFNAFLKTLEAPPLHAKFILATTEKHKIIPTILSRCQIFDFKRVKLTGELCTLCKKYSHYF
jgi:DNA polymerase-3 subunit gamma/tau